MPTPTERQCLHYLALSSTSLLSADLQLDAHGDFGARQLWSLCQSLATRLPSWLPSPISAWSKFTPFGDKFPDRLGSSLAMLGGVANDLFLASSLVVATCECRSPLGCGRCRSSRRGHLSRIQRRRRRRRRSQWHSERAELISRHTWCDRGKERRGGGTQITLPPQRRLPSFLASRSFSKGISI